MSTISGRGTPGGLSQPAGMSYSDILTDIIWIQKTSPFGSNWVPITETMGVNFGYVIKSANYTITTADRTIEVTSTSTQTLPTAVGNSGSEFRVINVSTGNVVVDTTSSQTIGNLSTGNPTSITLAPEEWLDVISNGTNYRKT